MSLLNLPTQVKDEATETAGEVVLSADLLCRNFQLPGKRGSEFAALDKLSFRVARGQTLAVVGESGSGKSTMAKIVLQLQSASSGSVRLRVKDENGAETLQDISEVPRKVLYRKIQMVFQDPYGSLNPRKRIWQIISDPLCNFERLTRAERKQRASQLLRQVGLGEAQLDAFPHMLSGGQRQRVSIARALVTSPEILILDEPLSALDVSVQAQIVNLLLDLQREMGLTYLFISHDLAVVRHFADQVLVMRAGKIVESGPVKQVLERPQQAYTCQLLNSVPGKVIPPAPTRPELKLLVAAQKKHERVIG